MAQEALISVISPETNRQKLGPDERPPEFGGPPGFFKPYPASITLAERLDTLENKTLNLKIPAGTKSGTKLRMSGHGLPVMKAKKKGDLYVKIQIKLPKKLTGEQKKLIEKLAQKGL